VKDELAQLKGRHSEEVKKWEANFAVTVERFETQKEQFRQEVEQRYHQIKEL
jgi:hypothetical protein